MDNVVIRKAVLDDAKDILKIYSYYVENTAIYLMIWVSKGTLNGRITRPYPKWDYIYKHQDA